MTLTYRGTQYTNDSKEVACDEGPTLTYRGVTYSQKLCDLAIVQKQQQKAQLKQEAKRAFARV